MFVLAGSRNLCLNTGKKRRLLAKHIKERNKIGVFIKPGIFFSSKEVFNFSKSFFVNDNTVCTAAAEAIIPAMMPGRPPVMKQAAIIISLLIKPPKGGIPAREKMPAFDTVG